MRRLGRLVIKLIGVWVIGWAAVVFARHTYFVSGLGWFTANILFTFTGLGVLCAVVVFARFRDRTSAVGGGGQYA